MVKKSSVTTSLATKADQSSLTNGLALKADASALALKAGAVASNTSSDVGHAGGAGGLGMIEVTEYYQ